MQISTIASALEEWAPPPIAESYDNVGLLVGDPNVEVSGALVNLDMTEEVVEEAIEKGIGLIVAHHPIWFVPRKRLNGEDYVSRTIIKAIKHDIALYACHTNLDNIRTGVNQRICEKLGLEDLSFLQNKPATEGEQTFGSGMIGRLSAPMSKHEFLTHVKTTFGCGGIRYADSSSEQIETVAVCGGAGSFLTKTARKRGADAFVTADITYHKFFDNEQDLLLLDIGHYESEQFTSELILEFFSKKFPTFCSPIIFSKNQPYQVLLNRINMDNPVAERLRALTLLQVLDSKLDEIHRLRGSLPEEVNDLEDDLEGLETRQARIEDDIKKLKQDISERKARIEEFGGQIKKYEEQQMNVKNNREFEALRKEIEYANLEILTSEKKIRQYGDQIDQKEDLLGSTVEQVEAKRNELEEKKQELKVIIEETKVEEKKLLAEIEKSSAKVEDRILNGYQKIRQNMRNGLAVVTTDRNACGGCFSIIPPQIHIELKQRRRLIHCENCGRILVDDMFFGRSQS